MNTWDTPGQHLATAIYCGAYVLVALGYTLVWRHASRGGRLLTPDADPGTVRWTTQELRIGFTLYVIALALAFVSVAASLAICVLLDCFWALRAACAADSGRYDVALRSPTRY